MEMELVSRYFMCQRAHHPLHCHSLLLPLLLALRELDIIAINVVCQVLFCKSFIIASIAILMHMRVREGKATEEMVSAVHMCA